MGFWPSTRARQVRKALERIGWRHKRQAATSHEILERPGWPDYTWAFHDGVELGPKMLSRVAKDTGLTPGDL